MQQHHLCKSTEQTVKIKILKISTILINIEDLFDLDIYELLLPRLLFDVAWRLTSLHDHNPDMTFIFSCWCQTSERETGTTR